MLYEGTLDWRAGDKSLEWLLAEAAAGEVFAAGHAESGNDLPLLLSTTKAERVHGGYRFTGRKGFGSLTPVWTRLGLHAMDSSDPAAPKIVHAFMPRDASGYTIKETWDVLGMRGTRSDDTVLEGAFVPDKYIGRVVSAGAAGIDHFVLGVFAWGVLGFATVYWRWGSIRMSSRVGDSSMTTRANTVFAEGSQRLMSMVRQRSTAVNSSARASCGRPLRAYNLPSPRWLWAWSGAILCVAARASACR